MIAEVLAFTAAASAAFAAHEFAARARRRDRGERAPFSALARAGRLVLPRPLPRLADLERQLLEAGRPGGLTAGDLLAAKVGACVAAAAVGLAAGVVLPGRLALVMGTVAPIAGFFVPDLWVVRRRRARAAALRRDLPALLDLLRVSIQAGASLPEGLAAVGRRSRAPLARMWGALAAQVALGVPLADALERHRREAPIEEVQAFTGALARAVRHGAPIADALAAQATAVRAARRRAIQEQAARAGPKMQLVVALLLVPSVMLLVAAALLAALADGDAGRMLSGF